MPFHEQHSIGYGFPSLLLVTCASAGVSELFLSTRVLFMESHIPFTRLRLVTWKDFSSIHDYDLAGLLHYREFFFMFQIPAAI